MEKSGEGLSIADKEAILEDAEPEKTDAEATTDGASGDPILGELLVDLGEKRLYLADVPKLMRLPVWEKQRAFRKDAQLQCTQASASAVLHTGYCLWS